MKKVSLSGSPREGVGKKDAAALRRSGRVPAVVYGGKAQVQFHVDNNQLEKVIYSPDVYQIDLEINDKVSKCVIKELQFHPVTDAVLHVDFLEVVDNKPVTMGLPVRTTGSSVGILNGGALSMNFRKIRVTGMVDDIPECIEVDISDMDIGDKVRVSDINLPGCTIVQSDSSVIVSIRKTRVAMSAETEEEGGEEGAEGTEGGEAAEGGEESASKE